MCSGQAPIPPSADPKGDELATAKFVRVAAILVVFAVGLTTLPKLGATFSVPSRDRLHQCFTAVACVALPYVCDHVQSRLIICKLPIIHLISLGRHFKRSSVRCSGSQQANRHA